jgi:putative transposase
MAASQLAQEWFSAAELAAMAPPGLPTSARGVALKSEREGWCEPVQKGVWWRERAGRGGGVEYHLSVLPLATQAKLSIDLAIAPEAKAPASAPDETDRHAMWAWFERQTDIKKSKARDRLLALQAVRELTNAGVPKVLAMQQVCELRDIALSSLYAWERLVHRVPRSDWLAYLAPRHAGQSGARAEISEEAWDFLRADYLRPEQPTLSACYRRLGEAAAEQGWAIPSEKTVGRKLDAIPTPVMVLARKGPDALKAMFPAQERDRGVFHALEAVNADGHKWDVFVKWPDGTIGRPLMVAFQDLYSGKMLSWRVDRSENKEAVRLAFGDLIDEYGIPDMCWLDNGRSFASKWLTGGIPNRFRFKVKDEDPIGIMTQLGVQVHWTTPYAGQSKPIERAFRDFAGDIAKHPKFAGAYVGNSPMAKPSNYGNAAIPLDVFLDVVGQEIVKHNARAGRQATVCAGRSFDTTFAESYARSPIRKASPEQRRIWLLAAEAVSTDRLDGSVRLAGNRFWAEFLQELRGQKVVVRCDPQNFHDDLHVYHLDGRYLGAAPCVEAVGFNDAEAARAHSRARNAWRRGVREQLDAERKMSLAQYAALLPAAETPQPAPETKVVRPYFGNTARQLAPQQDLEEQSPAEEALVAAMRRPRQLRVVENDD